MNVPFIAVVADGFSHRPPQVEAGAAPGGAAPIAAALWQTLGQRTLEALQRVDLIGGPEAAQRQGLGRRCGLTGLVDVVGGGRLEPARAVLLHTQVLRIGLSRRAAQLDGAQEMGVEQRVEFLRRSGGGARVAWAARRMWSRLRAPAA